MSIKLHQVNPMPLSLWTDLSRPKAKSLTLPLGYSKDYVGTIRPKLRWQFQSYFFWVPGSNFSAGNPASMAFA